MLFHPNPDDPDGPLGTFRPIIHQIPWHADPSPDPWKARVVVRAVIDRSVTLYQLAEIMRARTVHSPIREKRISVGSLQGSGLIHPSVTKGIPCQGESRGSPERPWRQDRMRTKGLVEDYLHRLRNQFYPDNEKAFYQQRWLLIKAIHTPPNGSTSALELRLRHPHHLFGDAVCFLLEDVSRLVDH
jgi:hypothetical protein